MHIVYKVKVDRKYMAWFPFDLIYLVHIEDRHLLPRLFPASLCFPIEDELKPLLGRLWTLRGNILADVYDKRLTVEPKQLHLVLPVEKLDEYFLLVPVMMETVLVKEHDAAYVATHPAVATKDQTEAPTVSKHRGPKYLTAKRHIRAVDNKFSSLFTHATVLFTPRGPMRPICLACPRHLLQIQGKCSLGGKECYLWLTLQGEQAADIKEVTDEQLHDDGADVDLAPTE